MEEAAYHPQLGLPARRSFQRRDPRLSNDKSQRVGRLRDRLHPRGTGSPAAVVAGPGTLRGTGAGPGAGAAPGSTSGTATGLGPVLGAWGPEPLAESAPSYMSNPSYAGAGVGAGEGGAQAAQQSQAAASSRREGGDGAALGVPAGLGHPQDTPKSPQLLSWAIQGAEESEEEVALKMRLVAQRGAAPSFEEASLPREKHLTAMPAGMLGGASGKGEGSDLWETSQGGPASWMESQPHSGTENVMSGGSSFVEGSSSVGASHALGTPGSVAPGPLRQATSGESEDDVAWEPQEQRSKVRTVLQAAQEGVGDSEMASGRAKGPYPTSSHQEAGLDPDSPQGDSRSSGGSFRKGFGSSTPMKGRAAVMSADSSPSKRRAQWGPPQISQVARSASLEEGQGSSTKASWTRRRTPGGDERDGGSTGSRPATKALMFQTSQRELVSEDGMGGDGEDGEGDRGSTNGGAFHDPAGRQGGVDVSDWEAESGYASAAWGAASAAEELPMVAVQALGTAVLDVSGARKALGTPMRRSREGTAAGMASEQNRSALGHQDDVTGETAWKASSGVEGREHGHIGSVYNGAKDATGLRSYSGWAHGAHGATEDDASAADVGERRYGLHLDTDTEAEAEEEHGEDAANHADVNKMGQRVSCQRLALADEEAEAEEQVGKSSHHVSAPSGTAHAAPRAWGAADLDVEVEAFSWGDLRLDTETDAESAADTGASFQSREGGGAQLGPRTGVYKGGVLRVQGPGRGEYNAKDRVGGSVTEASGDPQSAAHGTIPTGGASAVSLHLADSDEEDGADASADTGSFRKSSITGTPSGKGLSRAYHRRGTVPVTEIVAAIAAEKSIGESLIGSPESVKGGAPGHRASSLQELAGNADVAQGMEELDERWDELEKNWVGGKTQMRRASRMAAALRTAVERSEERSAKSGSATVASSTSHTPQPAPSSTGRMPLGLYCSDPKVDPKVLRRRLQAVKDTEGEAGAGGAVDGAGAAGPSPRTAAALGGQHEGGTESNNGTLVEEPSGRRHTGRVLKSLPLLESTGKGRAGAGGGLVPDSEAESEVPASSVASQRARGDDSVTEPLAASGRGARGLASLDPSQAWEEQFEALKAQQEAWEMRAKAAEREARLLRRQTEQQEDLSRTTEASLRAELELLREARERSRRRELEERGRWRKAAFQLRAALGMALPEIQEVEGGGGTGAVGSQLAGAVGGYHAGGASVGSTQRGALSSGANQGGGGHALQRNTAHLELFRALNTLLEAESGAPQGLEPAGGPYLEGMPVGGQRGPATRGRLLLEGPNGTDFGTPSPPSQTPVPSSPGVTLSGAAGADSHVGTQWGGPPGSTTVTHQGPVPLHEDPTSSVPLPQTLLEVIPRSGSSTPYESSTPHGSAPPSPRVYQGLSSQGSWSAHQDAARFAQASGAGVAGASQQGKAAGHGSSTAGQGGFDAAKPRSRSGSRSLAVSPAMSPATSAATSPRPGPRSPTSPEVLSILNPPHQQQQQHQDSQQLQQKRPLQGQDFQQGMFAAAGAGASVQRIGSVEMGLAVSSGDDSVPTSTSPALSPGFSAMTSPFLTSPVVTSPAVTSPAATSPEGTSPVLQGQHQPPGSTQQLLQQELNMQQEQQQPQNGVQTHRGVGRHVVSSHPTAPMEELNLQEGGSGRNAGTLVQQSLDSAFNPQLGHSSAGPGDLEEGATVSLTGSLSGPASSAAPGTPKLPTRRFSPSPPHRHASRGGSKPASPILRRPSTADGGCAGDAAMYEEEQFANSKHPGSGNASPQQGHHPGGLDFSDEFSPPPVREHHRVGHQAGADVGGAADAVPPPLGRGTDAPPRSAIFGVVERPEGREALGLSTSGEHHGSGFAASAGRPGEREGEMAGEGGQERSSQERGAEKESVVSEAHPKAPPSSRSPLGRGHVREQWGKLVQTAHKAKPSAPAASSSWEARRATGAAAYEWEDATAVGVSGGGRAAAGAVSSSAVNGDGGAGIGGVAAGTAVAEYEEQVMGTLERWMSTQRQQMLKGIPSPEDIEAGAGEEAPDGTEPLSLHESVGQNEDQGGVATYAEAQEQGQSEGMREQDVYSQGHGREPEHPSRVNRASSRPESGVRSVPGEGWREGVHGGPPMQGEGVTRGEGGATQAHVHHSTPEDLPEDEQMIRLFLASSKIPPPLPRSIATFGFSGSSKGWGAPPSARESGNAQPGGVSAVGIHTAEGHLGGQKQAVHPGPSREALHGPESSQGAKWKQLFRGGKDPREGEGEHAQPLASPHRTRNTEGLQQPGNRATASSDGSRGSSSTVQAPFSEQAQQIPMTSTAPGVSSDAAGYVPLSPTPRAPARSFGQSPGRTIGGAPGSIWRSNRGMFTPPRHPQSWGGSPGAGPGASTGSGGVSPITSSNSRAGAHGRHVTSQNGQGLGSHSNGYGAPSPRVSPVTSHNSHATSHSSHVTSRPSGYNIRQGPGPMFAVPVSSHTGYSPAPMASNSHYGPSYGHSHSHNSGASFIHSMGPSHSNASSHSTASSSAAGYGYAPGPNCPSRSQEQGQGFSHGEGHSYGHVQNHRHAMGIALDGRADPGMHPLNLDSASSGGSLQGTSQAANQPGGGLLRRMVGLRKKKGGAF